MTAETLRIAALVVVLTWLLGGAAALSQIAA